MSDSNLVLVTGGCGFVGSNLVRELVADGYRVRVLDNLSRGKWSYISDLDVELVEADITDSEAIEPSFLGVESVIHLAAYGSVVESVADPSANFDMNVRGTFNVLNASVKAGVKNFIFSSTGGALIGNATPPVSEHSLPKPISPYGASKLCCEAYCGAFSESYGLNTTCLRFANVYGPNSYHKTGVVNKFFHSIKDGDPFVIFGDGSSSRDYIHVSDLTNGIRLALKERLNGHEVIHLAAGLEITLSELANTVKKVADKPDHSILYEPTRVGEVERNFANYAYAQKVLGFSPKVSLEDGLQDLWDNYQW